MLFKTVQVKNTERAVVLRNGNFERILCPGKHRVWHGIDALKMDVCNIETTRFTHPLADYLLAKEPQVVQTEFVRVELSETEVGLLTENGVLVEILPPATRALFWKGLVDVRVEVLDIAQNMELSDELVKRITQTGLRLRSLVGLQGVLHVQVPDQMCGLLSESGKLVRQLGAGAHAFWKFGRSLNFDLTDLRLQALEVSGQEILTRDKVSLRINLAATWRFADVMKAHTELQKPVEHLYREVQFALRAAVGTRNLDDLLENKVVIDETVMQHLRGKLHVYGIAVESVGVKDIILPGEMKDILTQVVQATKVAEANVIRRREETAATRSLLNTAKVMEDNPIALRMKELETLERVAERIDKISVFGGLDQVLNGLVKLR